VSTRSYPRGSRTRNADFSNLVLDTWLNATETGRTEAFDALGRQLEQARARHEGAKALDEALFGQDFEAA
jgi:hypothetical protein